MRSSTSTENAISMLCILLIGMVCVYSVYDWWSPPVKSKDAPLNEFSAERAVEVLRFPTQMIHPFGTQENKRVRDYLVSVLRNIGVDPEIHTEYRIQASAEGRNSMERVDNIIVVLRGTAPTRSILVMGHYDTTPYGVGCADDGSAVAMMVETIRALLHSPPLKNDVIFLFTDGEEAGTLGPKTFMKHPLFNTVGLCLNFEARGHYGPSMMFQCSENNSWIIKEFSKVVPYPRASSMMFEVAGKMPTSTDYYVLKPKGVPGFDFAFVGGIRYYHTPNDNIQHLSLRSLQHHGEYALPLIRHFGNLDLSHLTIGSPFQEPKENRIYFSAPGNWMITYSEKWVIPLMGIAILGYLCLIFVMKLFWRIRILQIFGYFVGIIVLTIIIGAVLGGLIGLSFLIHKHYIVYYELTYFIAGLLLTMGLFLLLLRLIFAQSDPHLIYLASLLPWVVIAIHSSIATPSASYIPVWITIVGSMCGIIGVVPWLTPRWSKGASWFTLWVTLPGLVALYFLFPFMVLGVQTLTPVFIPVLMMILVISFFIHAGLIHELTIRSLFIKKMGWVIVIFGLLIYSYPLLMFRFTAETPKVNHLCYGLDWDVGKAWWLSRGAEFDEWTQQFFKNGYESRKPKEFTNDSIEVRFAEAPMALLDEPTISVLEDRYEEEFRRLKFAVVSNCKAPDIRLELTGGSIEIAKVKVNDADYSIDKTKSLSSWSLHFRGLPDRNLVIDLQLKHTEPLQLRVVEKSYVVPPLPGIDIPPRPKYMISEPNTVEWWKGFRSNAVYTKKTFTL